MRDIKFSCMWTDGKTWMDLRYTLAEMENGDHWEAMADMPMLRKFVLKHRRQFTGLQDKNGVDIYEGDKLKEEKEKGTFGSKKSPVDYSVVVWRGNGWKRESYNGEMKVYPELQVRFLEVIGNIHEANNEQSS